ncbi:50S ribosomal protein L25 [Candidatus Woesebacteria bacterium]|nr:50S ribosomal protein L25 [Candidatus Woesebacteria bacterium]
MTDNKITFHVQERTLVGKAAAKLKKDGLVAGNVYGLNQDSTAISLKRKEVEKILSDSESGLVYLKIGEGDKKIPTLIDEVVFHTLTRELQHVVFRRVSLKEKVTTEVSITLEGESSVPDSNVLQVLDSVEVESLPTEIPETIIVDLSQLTEIGQAISIQDIIKSSGFTIVCEEDQLENPVVLLQEMRAEEEEVEPTETEIIGKGKSEEGEDESTSNSGSKSDDSDSTKSE